jgi:hypothetical protein
MSKHGKPDKLFLTFEADITRKLQGERKKNRKFTFIKQICL